MGSTLKVGFIGLGIMGMPMAGHLMEAGYELTVYDLNTAAMDLLVARGAVRGESPQHTASVSDWIITMLPDSPEVEEVALGAGGIMDGARAGMLYADMSTIAPNTAIKVAEALGRKGIRCLDAPVSGGQVGAEQASLSIMAGGKKGDFDAFLPLFEKMGKTITLCGGNGAGQTVKACNQIQVAMNFAGLAEALVLGAKAGVDPAIIVKVLRGGYAQTRVMDVRGERMVKGDFTPGFKSKFHLKDLNIIMSTASDYQVPLPATSAVHELFTAMIVKGNGDLDHSGILTVVEELAGIKARTSIQD